MIKMKINILTNNSCPNSVAFNVPLIAAKKSFCARGFKLKFFSSPSTRVFRSEVLFINSNVFRTYWQDQKEEIFQFLTDSRNHDQQIIWFDTTDSTWCTQFEVLPYVDKFLKGQIYQDKTKYLKPFRTGRIFTDFFDDLYCSNEAEVNYPPPEKEYLDKIDISWNTCFENYTESRFALKNRMLRKLGESFLNYLKEPLDIEFTPSDKKRQMDISCRLGLSHSRPSVVAHRQKIIELLVGKGVDCGKVPLPEYFEELRNAKIGIGPFGVGEITLRDFEIIICGAVLLKPDLGHMQTWPELFVPEKTCVTHRWDLADFIAKIDLLLANPEFCREIASNAQQVYRKALSHEGMETIVDRLSLHIRK